MGNSRPRVRIVIAACGLVAAVAVALYARAAARALPEAAGRPVADAVDGLAVAAALYAVNWVLAWVYRASWPVTLGRCLVFAVVAYLGLSALVDVFGESRGLAWQILGVDPAADPVRVLGLRARAISHATVIALAAVCIGFGFERRREEVDAGEEEEGDDDGGAGGPEDER